MSETETVRGFNVSKGGSNTVTVLLWEAETEAGKGTREKIDERAAMTWAELAALGEQYKVAADWWTIDDDARMILDANS